MSNCGTIDSNTAAEEVLLQVNTSTRIRLSGRHRAYGSGSGTLCFQPCVMAGDHRDGLWRLHCTSGPGWRLVVTTNQSGAAMGCATLAKRSLQQPSKRH